MVKLRMKTEPEIRLHTQLALEVCQAQMSLADDHDEIVNWPDFKGCRPFLYQMRGERFRLRCRRLGANSFAPIFHGRFLAVPEGTLVEGRFKMHLFTRLFMTFWFGGLLVISAIVVGMAVTQREGFLQAGGMILGALLLAFFGYGLVSFGQWSARKEKRDIVTLLISVLEAKAIEMSDGPPKG